MKTRQLGSDGPRVSALALGCMAFSDSAGPENDVKSVSVIQAALEAGVTMLDTADFYGMGHNELLIREALWGARRENAFIAVKAGVQWGPDRAPLAIDVRPSSMKNYLAYSLRRLGTDYVDLYQPARIDSRIPIEDTIGAISDLVTQGYVRHVGLSDASAETIRRAHAVHPITALQTEYSVLARGVEDEILPVLRELGISLVADRAVSRRLLGERAIEGEATLAEPPAKASRARDEHSRRDLQVSHALADIASEHELSVAQLAIAWVASRGDDVIPLIGARDDAQLADAIAAMDAELTADDFAPVDDRAPTGVIDRPSYATVRMSGLNGERTVSR